MYYFVKDINNDGKYICVGPRGSSTLNLSELSQWTTLKLEYNIEGIFKDDVKAYNDSPDISNTDAAVQFAGFWFKLSELTDSEFTKAVLVPFEVPKTGNLMTTTCRLKNLRLNTDKLTLVVRDYRNMFMNITDEEHDSNCRQLTSFKNSTVHPSNIILDTDMIDRLCSARNKFLDDQSISAVVRSWISTDVRIIDSLQFDCINRRRSLVEKLNLRNYNRLVVIINLPYQRHWVTASIDNDKIMYYDSLGKASPTNIQEQLLEIHSKWRPNNTKKIDFDHIKISVQNDSYTCGYHAIWIAWCLFNKYDIALSYEYFMIQTDPKRMTRFIVQRILKSKLTRMCKGNFRHPLKYFKLDHDTISTPQRLDTIHTKFEKLANGATQCMSGKHIKDITKKQLESMIILIDKLWFPRSGFNSWITVYKDKIMYKIDGCNDDYIMCVERNQSSLTFTVNSTFLSKNTLTDIEKFRMKELKCDTDIKCLCVTLLHEYAHMIQYILYRENIKYKHTTLWCTIVKNLFGFNDPEFDDDERGSDSDNDQSGDDPSLNNMRKIKGTVFSDSDDGDVNPDKLLGTHNNHVGIDDVYDEEERKMHEQGIDITTDEGFKKLEENVYSTISKMHGKH